MQVAVPIAYSNTDILKIILRKVEGINRGLGKPHHLRCACEIHVKLSKSRHSNLSKTQSLGFWLPVLKDIFGYYLIYRHDWVLLLLVSSAGICIMVENLSISLSTMSFCMSKGILNGVVSFTSDTPHTNLIKTSHGAIADMFT